MEYLVLRAKLARYGSGNYWMGKQESALRYGTDTALLCFVMTPFSQEISNEKILVPELRKWPLKL
jgi:hypothetical protein